MLLTAGIVVLVLAGWAVSLCLHEFGHALVAYRGGDRSVRAKGYLTLDIRRYTDVGLSFVLPVVFLLLGGIPLPGGAVWINHGAIRSAGGAQPRLAGRPADQPGHRRGAARWPSRVVPMPIGLAIGLSCLALIQVLAFVLNILPMPGLDGFGVLEPFLPPSARQLAARVRPWAPIVLFLVLIGVPGASAGCSSTSAARSSRRSAATADWPLTGYTSSSSGADARTGAGQPRRGGRRRPSPATVSVSPAAGRPAATSAGRRTRR